MRLSYGDTVFCVRIHKGLVKLCRFMYNRKIRPENEIEETVQIINGGNPMTRREAREHCFKMLFCQDFYPAEEKEEQLERYFDAPVEDVTGKDGADEVLHQVDLEGADKTALEARVEAIMKKIPELDEKINGVAEGWKTRRMGRVELTILRLALFEMKEDQEIPEKVAINEAVELAKKFGGDGAPAFVNGILGSFVRAEFQDTPAKPEKAAARTETAPEA